MIDALQGHWRRAWIKAPGLYDDTTEVHWLQAGPLFADIRLPADPKARADGFAGHITVQGAICTWHREIDLHGPSENVDAGDMVFESPDLVFEHGVHATYTERWERLGTSGKAYRLTAGHQLAYLVHVGAQFVFGLGDPAVPDPEAVFAFGTWHSDEGTVTRATDPAYVGLSLVQLSETSVRVARPNGTDTLFRA